MKLLWYLLSLFELAVMSQPRSNITIISEEFIKAFPGKKAEFICSDLTDLRGLVLVLPLHQLTSQVFWVGKLQMSMLSCGTG